MKFTPDDKYQVIPPTHFRCVWMVAGVLSYQLCDREFDCDKCPLDAAMRKHFGPTQPVKKSRASRQNTSGTSEYLYSRNHCWISPGAHARVRIGLEPKLAGNLLSPKAVVFPRVGDRVVKGSTCLWIVLEGGTFAVTSVVGGTVVAINANLADEPHELCLHPLSKGWLYEMRVAPTELQSAKLLSKCEAEELHTNEAQHFRALLSDALKGGGEHVGITLQDGGQAMSDVSRMLGPKRYFQLLREVYG